MPFCDRSNSPSILMQFETPLLNRHACGSCSILFSTSMISQTTTVGNRVRSSFRSLLRLSFTFRRSITLRRHNHDTLCSTHATSMSNAPSTTTPHLLARPFTTSPRSKTTSDCFFDLFHTSCEISDLGVGSQHAARSRDLLISPTRANHSPRLETLHLILYLCRNTPPTMRPPFLPISDCRTFMNNRDRLPRLETSSNRLSCHLRSIHQLT